ncbi:hypothetical protein [Fictibacillus barbaricus]|uniref:Uncharacterized protein n=1 Tax=Fictibacillus barbaricus TaxID=182136 RepID=A0ABS2ZEQ7_9BACL|nr:hypothetical protein [Fictibacillus barbaricus]MBN3545104.1 hypothetical protein [Fictibacillus barbaricus]GGB61684.1 hypothetical protein GCM10007199_29450 [Fictibacillus barbaricus]
MSAVNGTYKLVFNDMRWFLILFSCITLAVSVIYLLISMIFNVPANTNSSLFGPIYGGICAFACAGLVQPFQVAIGLGSTRKQFLKSYYAMAGLMVVASITFLNVLYFIMDFLLQKGINKFKFFHPGYMESQDYHFFTYYWFDLMIGFLLMGLTALVTVLIRRMGIVNFLIAIVLLGMALTFILIPGNAPLIFEWIVETDVFLFFTTIGIIGIAMLLLTYPMMKDAPLKMKSSKR